MKKLHLMGAVAALFFCATAAYAGPIQTITLKGTLGNSYDGSPLFRATTGDLIGSAFTITLSYDTALLTSPTCVGVATHCQFNFGAGTTETVEINSITKVFSVTSGQIAFNVDGTTDSLQISTNNVRLNASLYDSTALFSSQTNTNTTTDLAAVTDLALGASSSLGSGVGSNTTLNSTGTIRITTSRTTTAVPEPLTLSVFAAGLLGAGAVRRRKKS